MYPYDESVSTKPVTWIVVADGRQMRVYECRQARRVVPKEGTGKHLYHTEEPEWKLTPRMDMAQKAESPKDYQMGHDHRGSIFGSSPSVRHTVEPHVNIRQDLKRRFMESVTAKLERAYGQKLFDHLIIAAPPRLLGALRKYLSSDITKRVVAELPKELGQYSTKELLAYVKPALAPVHPPAA